MKSYIHVFVVLVIAIVISFEAAACQPVPGGATKKELIEACEKGDLEKVKSILSKSPELVNAKHVRLEVDESGKDRITFNRELTPLIAAIIADKQFVVEYLLSKGADANITVRLLYNEKVNGKPQRGVVPAEQIMGPLQVAASNGQAEICIVLIGGGAQVNAVMSPEKVSALQLALMSVKMQEFNKEIFPNSDGLKTVRLLVDEGADLNVRQSESGNSLLHSLVLSEEMDAALILIKGGADLNARNNDGLTPLGMAKKYKKNKMAAFLKKHGAKE
ncbi:MAG: ankyrin repeat domain-containing protein [bacterium]|jgi:ankyrin repeat protein